MLALLITAFDLNAFYRQGISKIEHLHANVELVHSDSLVEHLWSLNDRAAQGVIDGLVRLDYIDRIELRWEEAGEMAAGAPLQSAEVESVFFLGKTRVGQQYPLGELRVYSTLTVLQHEVVSELWQKLLLNLLQALIVSGVVLYCFHRLATVHLHAIALHADSLVLGQSYKSLTLDRSIKLADDDLQSLVNAINGMGCRLQREFLNTKQKKIELEKQVNERTKHLADANQKLLEKSRLITIGSLVAMVAHELRNPLGSIKASVNLLHLRASNADDRKVIERIDRSIERCDQTVEQLRQMGNKSVEHWDVIELGPWLREYVGSKLLLNQGNELRCELADDVRVFVDQFQLDMVVRNLFENAQHAVEARAEHAQRLIVLQLESDEQGALLRLRDTGVGLNELTLKRAFDPLYTTKQYGFGMGLSLSKNLIEFLGGKLTITSEGSHKGAVAEVRLPLAKEVQKKKIAHA